MPYPSLFIYPYFKGDHIIVASYYCYLIATYQILPSLLYLFLLQLLFHDDVFLLLGKLDGLYRFKSIQKFNIYVLKS